ncbi:MAG: glyoxalase [Phormidesmis sp. RL_2_1]|nr:glyoxalase [Phormidesmis sp. RL_2_1]
MFYSKLLAVEPTLNTPTYAEFQLAGLRLAIFIPKADNADEFAAATSGPMSLCLEVDNLAGAIAHLSSIGYPPPGDIMHTSHGQEIYAYDPDGNRLILHQPKSQ